MITFVAGRIMLESDKSLDQGRNKYAAYFVNTFIYSKYQMDVDTILIENGYADVIVAKEF